VINFRKHPYTLAKGPVGDEAKFSIKNSICGKVATQLQQI